MRSIINSSGQSHIVHESSTNFPHEMFMVDLNLHASRHTPYDAPPVITLSGIRRLIALQACREHLPLYFHGPCPRLGMQSTAVIWMEFIVSGKFDMRLLLGPPFRDKFRKDGAERTVKVVQGLTWAGLALHRLNVSLHSTQTAQLTAMKVQNTFSSLYWQNTRPSPLSVMV